VWCVISRSDVLFPVLNLYLLLLGIGLIIYMVRALSQYRRWLRDNYADLEHKEVWQSFVVLAVILVFCGIYTSGLGGPVYKYVVQVNAIALICYLLWRVETLSDLSISEPLSYPIEEEILTTEEEAQATEEEETNITENTEE